MLSNNRTPMEVYMNSRLIHYDHCYFHQYQINYVPELLIMKYKQTLMQLC